MTKITEQLRESHGVEYTVRRHAARAWDDAQGFGLTQAEMDRRMSSALSNGQIFNFYETGRERIPTHHALALCRTCNITPGLDLSRADAQLGA